MEGEGVCVGGKWIGGLAGRDGDCMRAAFRVLASIIHEPQAFGDIYYSAVTFLCGVGVGWVGRLVGREGVVVVGVVVSGGGGGGGGVCGVILFQYHRRHPKNSSTDPGATPSSSHACRASVPVRI